MKLTGKFQVRRQAPRLNSTRTGMISSLPMTIQAESTPFERADRVEKFPAGPTRSSPGPTLLTQVRAEVKDTEKETSSSETTSAPARMMAR